MQKNRRAEIAWRIDGLSRGGGTSRLKGIPGLGTLPNYSHKKTKIEILCNLDRDAILVLRVAISSSEQYIESITRFCSCFLFRSDQDPVHFACLSQLRYVIIFGEN